ncbi:histidine phosphotransferase [Sulfitobacter mediterraneus]|uniref:histidine phosphotransferase family protein n=1 Tax=Sulfitobacter mediterraneus TaxID=83219 RepID=UPI001933AFEA|nr:histidine phosphotransferase family protein [Sulfitobacter mediterraneus]MBM1312397.1 histidine phosphotransferase [Sulfitobacter mediterraneus]MBM1316267.1 histidine phosphotransferase [Sulfitobacter mediterraneus]MBM1324665.1 histidine phosphotransferase [Sulfitobacter mediterraneus]MBM1328543.1 histidine phosphotransferase [Sulfitobacter mediterraneus]MBM1399899.1 histidine phosphotransferase [Sulfitobacter mediterraneus]
MTAPNLVALVGSRICHDLISPIGAINNGLELMSLSGAGAGPEMSLIGESVGNASARIRFFRIAFGAAGDQMIGQTEVCAILRDLYEGGRLTVHWRPTTPQPRAAVRLAFLGLLCCETAMPYGGRLEIAQHQGDWSLTAQADRLNIDSGLWAMLSGAAVTDALLPAHVQFGLVPQIATEEGRKIIVQSDETRLTLTF